MWSPCCMHWESSMGPHSPHKGQKQGLHQTGRHQYTPFISLPLYGCTVIHAFKRKKKKLYIPSFFNMSTYVQHDCAYKPPAVHSKCSVNARLDRSVNQNVTGSRSRHTPKTAMYFCLFNICNRFYECEMRCTSVIN